MSVALAYVVKPLFLVVLFGTARMIAWGLWRLWPDGRAKRYLFQDTGPL